MHLVRPATTRDLDSLYALAMKSSLGLTNLPKDKALLSKMLSEAGNELYIFCLERVADQKILGTSMIRAKCPDVTPLPYFLRYPEKGFDLLHLTFETEGITELCGLFIDSEARKGGLGHLLSISRLLFIADHLKKFNTKIFAEIRGFVEENGNCPFWDGLMLPFFKLPFKEGVNFYIKDLASFNQKIPSFPIYYDLLPEETRKYIGVIHPKSVPAINMLEKEGFQMTPLIHPLDGGPRVEGLVGSLHGIQESQVIRIGSIQPNEGPIHLIATTVNGFKTTLGKLTLHKGEAIIEPETAKLLQLGVGALCRTLPLR